MAQENILVELDLNGLTQSLEKSVILVGESFNVITHNRKLNVLSAVQDKQKAKNIIKDQTEPLES